MKIVLISVHDGASDRKTGFHFWANILSNRGHDVRFVTAGSSLISLLKKNGKQLKKPFNTWVEVAPKFLKYTWVPVIHPFNTGKDFLDKLLTPLFRIYPFLMPASLRRELTDADYFIVENGAGALLVPSLVKDAPNARYVYNLSDRFSVVKFHPVIVQGNFDSLRHFDLIRLNAEAMASELPANANPTYVPQAIDKTLFDASHDNPYTAPKNVISVGDMLFDARVIEILSEAFPDWTFHVFGKKARLNRPLANVKEYGEFPFNRLVPYLKNADIGLAPYSNTPDIEYLSQSSLKFVQYTYCRLPIVAPLAAKGNRSNVIGYSTSDNQKSVIDAFRGAMAYDRSQIDQTSVLGWEDMIDRMIALADEGYAKRRA